MIHLCHLQPRIRRTFGLALSATALLAAPHHISAQTPATQPTTTRSVTDYGIQIGRETTYLTGPLLPDGSIDYAAALNEQYDKHLTPDQNAACLMSRIVVVDGETDYSVSPDVLQAIGVPANSPTVTFTALREDLHQLVQEREALTRPWKSADMPEVAAWLDKQEPVLALFAEASRKPGWWMPVKLNNHMLVPASLKLWHIAVRIEEATLFRSMRKLGEGDAQGAWEDILACRRLAEISAASPQIDARYVSVMMSMRAAPSLSSLIEHGEFSANLLQQIDEELRREKPWPLDGQYLTPCDRYQFIIVTTSLAKPLYEKTKEHSQLRQNLDGLNLYLPDFNSVLRSGNVYYDELLADRTRMTPQQKTEHRRSLTLRFNELVASQGCPPGYVDRHKVFLTRPGETAEAYANRISASLILLTLPHLPSLEDKFDGLSDNNAWTRVAIAVMRYRDKHGDYPADLSALIPEFLPVLPPVHSDDPVQYRAKANGFSLATQNSSTTQHDYLGMIKIRRDK